jgi:antirestriction protein
MKTKAEIELLERLELVQALAPHADALALNAANTAHFGFREAYHLALRRAAVAAAAFVREPAEEADPFKNAPSRTAAR